MADEKHSSDWALQGVWIVLHLCYPTCGTTKNRKPKSLASSVYRIQTAIQSRDNFAETSLECGNALCMARNTGALTKSAYTCPCLLQIWSQMLLSLPIGNYSSLRGCWGTWVWQGGEVCVCVSKGGGGCPRCLFHRASTAHLNITDWLLTFTL